MKSFMFNKVTCNILVIIAFAIVIFFLLALTVAPGLGELVLNRIGRIIIVVFWPYFPFAFIFPFIRIFRLWRNNSPEWRKEMTIFYLLFITFAVAGSFLAAGLGYSTGHEWAPLLLILTFSLLLLFPIGVTSFVIGLKSIKFRQGRPGGYRTIAFITATICGGLPIWWLMASLIYTIIARISK